MTTKIYAVIPVYNESQNLKPLSVDLLSLAQELYPTYRLQVVLVDDGSTDGTPQLASKLFGDKDFTLLAQQYNHGPGFAFGTGFEHLASVLEPSDWVLTMEGDNTSDHRIVKQMLSRTREGYEVVLASPYLYGGGIENTNSTRVLLSHGGNFFIKWMLGLRGILTMSSFFRLYAGTTILRLQTAFGPRIIEHNGYEGMVELLAKLVYTQASISEVPMVLDTSQRAGKSKMRVARTMLGYFSLVKAKARWTRMVGGL
jgi:dolichol-phosphate mannosyltransferase